VELECSAEDKVIFIVSANGRVEVKYDAVFRERVLATPRSYRRPICPTETGK
jgi:hypothetical protein